MDENRQPVADPAEGPVGVKGYILFTFKTLGHRHRLLVEVWIAELTILAVRLKEGFFVFQN
jgi:hypothetical protein